MEFKVLNISIPNEIFVALNEPEEKLNNDFKLFAAINFYQTNRLSIGSAAKLVGIPIYEFEQILSKKNIPISNLTLNDIKSDIDKLRNITV